MGLFDIVKKALTGASDEDNIKNKARMREIFNSCVENGDDYKLIYCHMQNETNAVVVKVTRHSNFIVGYKEGEVVIINVNATLTEYSEPEYFNKENGATIKTFVGYCVADKENVHYQFEPITFEPGIVKGAKYSVAITQSGAEVSEFRKFFKRGL
ncbi:hypothetical protein [Parvimonas micra]